MTRRRSCSCLVLTLLFFLAGLLAWQVFVPLKSDQMVIRVSPGDNAGGIASHLKEQGIIRSKMLFKTLAKMRGTDRRLIAGTYTLGGNHSLYRTLLMLEQGNTTAVSITFPEGLSLYKTLRRIEQSGLASYKDLQAAATDTAFVRLLTGFKAPSLEGFLHPETYAFDISFSPREILAQMTDQFFLQTSRAEIDPHRTGDFYQKLILASIVEKESAQPDERQLVASVMANRLRRGMNLASCSTVDYILEKQGVKRPVLTLNDTKLPSPYNTYINSGLPPGPICNPSLPSLQAAIQPADTNYLYFVADRKGNNDFSSSAEEHLRKVRKYRRSEWQ